MQILTYWLCCGARLSGATDGASLRLTFRICTLSKSIQVVQADTQRDGEGNSSFQGPPPPTGGQLDPTVAVYIKSLSNFWMPPRPSWLNYLIYLIPSGGGTTMSAIRVSLSQGVGLSWFSTAA